MGDIRIVWDPTTGTGDFNMLGAGWSWATTWRPRR